jgi:hypothetical protein
MMRDYLVFEVDGEPVPAYTCFFHRYACVGGVRATDPVDACKVIAGVTGRVGKYAVIEAAIVDLTADEYGIDAMYGIDPAVAPRLREP